MEIMMRGMLCVSGTLDTNATQDALSPDVLDDVIDIDIKDY